MNLLYNLGIFFYNIIIHIAALFNEKAKLFVMGRKSWKSKLKNSIQKNMHYIWFHCASLGEFEQGRPIIEEIKKQFPSYKIILTFFSPSGYEIRKNYSNADIVCYLPLDTKNNARTFIQLVRPEKVFFVKYEFWHNYITELKRQKIPLYGISVIFRENQQFFKNTPWGKWYQKILPNFNHLFVQDKKSATLLSNIGISNFSIAGDTRFDRVASIAAEAKQLKSIEKFKGNSRVIIAGSTWKPDEELILEFINKQDDAKNLKFIIAPHEVSSTNINRIQQLLKTPAILFSEIENSSITSSNVLIIDSIGILSSLYQYGNIAYIGGGFGVGIHNILEAATFSLPIIFGPNYKKFKEATDLIEKKGAFSIHDYKTLYTVLTLLLNNTNQLEEASKTNANYIEKNVGATKIVLKKVFNN